MKYLLHNPIRKWIWSKIYQIRKNMNPPIMIWGYWDSSGEFRKRTRISNTVFMYHPERIRISDNVFIWHYTIIDGTGGVEIGEGSQIGAWVGIFTHSSHIAIRLYGNHYQEIPEYEKKGYQISDVKIGKYVFIGAGAKILPGVRIGDGAIVSVNSVVKQDVPPFAIVDGNPAKIIGDVRHIDNKWLVDPQLEKWYHEWQNK